MAMQPAEQSVPEVITEQYVEDLLSRAVLPVGRIQPLFVEQMTCLAGWIQESRVEQAIQPYTVDDLRTVIHANVLAKAAHGDQRRESGELYYDEHILGAQEIAVKKLGRSRVAVIDATAVHDVKEDTMVKTRGQFEGAWRATFRDANDPLLGTSQKTVQRTYKLMDALTKVELPGGGREIKSAFAIRKILAAMQEFGLDVLHPKLADRLHNMKSLDYKMPEAQERIGRETYEIYVRLPDVLGIQQYVREAAELCLQVLNPSLLEGFRSLREARGHAQFDQKMVKYKEQEMTVEDFLKEVFSRQRKTKAEQHLLLEIVRHNPVSAQVADYALRLDEPAEKLTLQGLGISSLDPLQEYEVITASQSSQEGQRSVAHAIRDHILKYCYEQNDRWTLEPANERNSARGFFLIINSRKLGVLKFRINDAVSEAISRRGTPLLHQKEEKRSERVPSQMAATISQILRETEHDVRRVVPLARERFVRPTVTVFTPKNKMVTLPSGSTALDFVPNIHSGLLRRMYGVVLHDSLTKFRQTGIFEPLPDNAMVEILVDGKEGAQPMLPDPGWILFCRTDIAKGALCKMFKMRGAAVNLSEGMGFAERIEKLFGLEQNDVLSAVRRKFKDLRKDSEEEIFKKIGRGEVDVMGSLFGEDAGIPSWRTRVLLPNEPGILRKFLKEFEREGVNVDDFSHYPQREPNPHVLYMSLRSALGEKGAFGMARMMLKLSYEYPITAIPKKTLSARLRLAWDYMKYLVYLLNRPIVL